MPAPPEPAAHEPLAALEAARVDAFVGALVARREPPHLPPIGPVTGALYDRLLPEDIVAVEAALTGPPQDLWEQMTPEHRKVLAPIFAVLYDIPGAVQRTGLVRAAPPEDVHTMARGPLTYGGDPAIADLVVRVFDDAGIGLPEHGSVLDFGCSSGRVVRVLGAYRPDLTWLGCDPNEDAIGWAAEHLPMARFFTSTTAPPLDLETGSVDRAYAISIWSHFGAESALAWLEEMHRVVKPGGGLLVTTHGLDTLARQLREDLMTHDSAAEATAAMLRAGHQYFDVFGEDGDWGVKDPGWGNAYVGADWLAARVTPQWSIRLFRPAMLDRNQDVLVLERRP